MEYEERVRNAHEAVASVYTDFTVTVEATKESLQKLREYCEALIEETEKEIANINPTDAQFEEVNRDLLQQGTQIIYVPRHAEGDETHPDCETGFVTTLVGPNAFCRYWRKVDPFGLRTTANSELTPIEQLVERNTVSQQMVEEHAARHGCW